jgi:hypothetical protein
MIKMKMFGTRPLLVQIKKAKMQQEMKFMYNMTKPIIDMALADKFSKPKKRISKNKFKRKAPKFRIQVSVANTIDTLNDHEGINDLTITTPSK